MDKSGLLRPIDIARKIGMSTSALRHYESWGLVPPVPRSPTGYRLYTRQHLAYYECIRSMGDGFGIKRTGAVMRCIIRGEVDEALWIVNEAQAQKNRDKQIALRALQLLSSTGKLTAEEGGSASSTRLTIKTIVQETGIAASAIRYWDQLGLLETERDTSSGYRLFHPDAVKQVALIKTLRNAGYSLPTIQGLLRQVNEHQVAHAIELARSALDEMNQALRLQLVGLHELYKLLRELELL